MKAKLVLISLVLFFLSPYFLLLYYIPFKFDFDFLEVLMTLKNSLIQGLSTAGLSIIFGFLTGISILSLPQNIKQTLQKILLIPIYLPSLFIILIALSLVNPFPMGNLGIIIVLFLMHYGYVVSVVSVQAENLLGSSAVVSSIYNIGRYKFFIKILIPQMKNLIGLLFAVIFINSITAFTVPLIVGGGRGSNLEILIYEKIFIDFKWSAAILIGLVQQIFIAIVTYSLTMKKNVFNLSSLNLNFKFNNNYIFKSSYLLLVAYVVAFIFGYFSLSLSALSSPITKEIFNSEFNAALLNSIFLFGVNILFFSCCLIMIIFLIWNKIKIQFINLFMSSSAVLVGAAYYFFFPTKYGYLDIIKISVVFNILFFVSLYKSILEQPIEKLLHQFNVARVYNLSFANFFKNILFNQIRKVIFYVLSILLIMSISEFAIIKVTGAEFKTLGVLMASYLSSYRIEGAFVMSFVILVIWALTSTILGALLGINKKS